MTHTFLYIGLAIVIIVLLYALSQMYMTHMLIDEQLSLHQISNNRAHADFDNKLEDLVAISRNGT